MVFEDIKNITTVLCLLGMLFNICIATYLERKKHENWKYNAYWSIVLGIIALI